MRLTSRTWQLPSPTRSTTPRPMPRRQATGWTTGSLTTATPGAPPTLDRPRPSGRPPHGGRIGALGSGEDGETDDVVRVEVESGLVAIAPSGDIVERLPGPNGDACLIDDELYVLASRSEAAGDGPSTTAGVPPTASQRPGLRRRRTSSSSVPRKRRGAPWAGAAPWWRDRPPLLGPPAFTTEGVQYVVVPETGEVARRAADEVATNWSGSPSRTVALASPALVCGWGRTATWSSRASPLNPCRPVASAGAPREVRGHSLRHRPLRSASSCRVRHEETAVARRRDPSASLRGDALPRCRCRCRWRVDALGLENGWVVHVVGHGHRSRVRAERRAACRALLGYGQRRW